MNSLPILVYGVIYKITCLSNHKCYIGQTTANIDRRFLGHIRQAEKFSHDKQMVIARAINKYGKENFTIQILDIAQSLSELNYKEIFYIKYFNSLVKNGFGYNVAEGGSNGNNYAGKTEEEMNEIAQKQRYNHTGRIIINNGENYLSVKRENLVDYLSCGWELGIGLARSEEMKEKAGLKNGMKHREMRWVNNNFEELKVNKKDCDYYVSIGFSLGRISNKVWVTDGCKDFQVLKTQVDTCLSSNFRIGRSTITKGKIGITKENKNKYVNENDLEKYLESGWCIGSALKGKTRKIMKKDNVQEYVLYSDIDNYLSCGWTFGTIGKRKPKEKGEKAIKRKGESKFVNEKEIQNYLADGWVLGSLTKEEKLTAKS